MKQSGQPPNRLKLIVRGEMDLDEKVGTGDGYRRLPGRLIDMELIDFKMVMLSIGGSMRWRIGCSMERIDPVL